MSHIVQNPINIQLKEIEPLLVVYQRVTGINHSCCNLLSITVQSPPHVNFVEDSLYLLAATFCCLPPP